MSGPALVVGATVMCPHGAPATVVTSNARVLANGQPVALLTDTHPVAACPFQVPIGTGTKPQPCVTTRWLVGATRVLVNGQPALTQGSVGLCSSPEQIPQGPPLVSATQPRVVAV